MKKLLCAGLLAALGIIGCYRCAFAFYVPAAPALRGIGGANVQTIDTDFRSLEQAALLFSSENPEEAIYLTDGVNHVALLAQYTDNPSRFADISHYGFIVDSRGWWIGIAVTGSDSTREYVTQAARTHGWLGSSDISVPPGDAVFGGRDSVVWKFVK